MTFLFTFVIQFGIVSGVLSCSSPQSSLPQKWTVDTPLHYACVIDTPDGRTYITRGWIYEVPEDSEPKLIDPGDEL